MSTRTRYLPPGTLTWLRVKWLLLGLLLGVGTMAALAMYAAAIRPPELPYRPAPATVEPPPTGEAAPKLARLELGPCPAGAKDCAVLPDPAIRTIPEPGTAALVGVAAGAMFFFRRKA